MATKTTVLPKGHLLINPYFLASLAVDFAAGFLASLGLKAGMSVEWLLLVTMIHNVTGVLFLVAYLQQLPGLDEAYRKFGIAAAGIATLTGLVFGQVPDHPILFAIGLALGLYVLVVRPRESVEGLTSLKMLVVATVVGFGLGFLTNYSIIWSLTFAVADVFPAILAVAVAKKYPRFLYPTLALAFVPAALAFTLAIASAESIAVPSTAGSISSVLLASVIALGYKKKVDWKTMIFGAAGIVLIIMGFGVK